MFQKSALQLFILSISVCSVMSAQASESWLPCIVLTITHTEHSVYGPTGRAG